MILVIFILSIVILVACGIYFLSAGKVDRKAQILSELGLTHGFISPLKSPFYKWGWRKSSDDRVWGERIVRETFEKHNIGLSQKDLEYFQDQCQTFAQGGTINKTAIIAYIDKLLARNSSVSDYASKFIEPILKQSLNASPSQAQKVLDRARIDSSAENAPDRLAIYQLRKMLNNHALKIVCSNEGGMDIKNESGSLLMNLSGLESWEFWLKSCSASLEKCLSQMPGVTSVQAKYIKKQIISDYIHPHQNHVKNTRTFVQTLEKILVQEGLPKTRTDIENIDRAFFSWVYSEGTQFTIQNHTALRTFLTLPELPPRFRQAIMDYITPAYESLHALLPRFPRHVIFFGAKDHIRSYALQQYVVHLNRLYKEISAILDRTFRFPLVLRIFPKDVDKARNPDPEEEIEKPAEYRHKTGDIPNDHADGSAMSGNKGHMPLLMDTQKKMILFEKNINPNTAEKMGWIIDLPIEDFTPKESAQLDLGDYLKYKRINCDQYGDFEEDNESKSAQMQRTKCLNKILDALLEESVHQVIPEKMEEGT